MELSARKGISISKNLIISYLKVSIQSDGNVGFSSDYNKPLNTLAEALTNELRHFVAISSSSVVR